MAERDYLFPGEVANKLGVSRRTITRWASNGYLPCTKTLGGHHRFDEASIESIVTEQSKPESN